MYPGDNRRRRCRLHQLGGDVGVDDDHADRSAARGTFARGGSSSSTPPNSRNRSRSAAKRLVAGTGSRTASAKMARISASIDRPCWAALIRSRSRTSSSRPRMLNAATTARISIRGRMSRPSGARDARAILFAALQRQFESSVESPVPAVHERFARPLRRAAWMVLVITAAAGAVRARPAWDGHDVRRGPPTCDDGSRARG